MEKVIAQTSTLKAQRISRRLSFPIVLFLTVTLPPPSPAQVAPEKGPPSVIVQITERQSFRMELAYKYIGDQIEAKLERERNASALDPLWRAGFWRYIPFVPGGPSKIVDDAFLTPNYLSSPYRQLDLGLAMSEKRALWEVVYKGAKPREKR
jgi:hypothetical protein